MKVGVIDYGVGNLGSVMRALEELKASPILISHARDLRSTDYLILPGVGNFADCARLLTEEGWTQAILDEVQDRGKPLLGVCVGMQLLATSSMEGASVQSPSGTPGLGLVPGHVEHLRTLGCNLRIPHVGWNEVTTSTTGNGLFDGIPEKTDFYFVHSYSFVPNDPSNVLAYTNHDIPVVAAVRRDNVWGVQFHPEKSSRAGFKLLRNFIDERKW